MKLGVCYVVFDGIELLEYSARQIRPHAEYIGVLFQRTSWFGSRIKEKDLSALEALAKTGLVDELMEFSSFSALEDKNHQSVMLAKQFEMRKRQAGLERCLEIQCTHYLCMDVDEFYLPDQFSKAKEEIKTNKYGSTASSFINYVRKPTMHRGYDAIKVPFICEISNHSCMTNNFFVRCDPTRGIHTPTELPSHLFSPDDLTMHHMETVRLDLKSKYESTTRIRMKRDHVDDLVGIIRTAENEIDFRDIIFPNSGIIDIHRCDNKFGIPYEEWGFI